MVYAHDANSWTALDYAVLGGHMEAIRLLTPILPVLSSIGDSEIVGSGAPVPDEFLEAHQDYLSRALLKCLARTSNAAICEHLISEGADVNTRDTNYWNSSPLFYATGKDNLAAIQLLLTAGADPNLGDRDGVVPLFHVTNIPARRRFSRLERTSTQQTKRLATCWLIVPSSTPSCCALYSSAGSTRITRTMQERRRCTMRVERQG
ncbi:ankyrin repeat-containing domain protein [Mycena sanguinolenta]|nr:ankyrin repeat-containing domain protein [Mycena sanguinolenta]